MYFISSADASSPNSYLKYWGVEVCLPCPIAVSAAIHDSNLDSIYAGNKTEVDFKIRDWVEEDAQESTGR